MKNTWYEQLKTEQTNNVRNTNETKINMMMNGGSERITVHNNLSNVWL